MIHLEEQLFLNPEPKKEFLEKVYDIDEIKQNINLMIIWN